MSYLRNPSGRIVAVNESEVESWLLVPGFTKLMPGEEIEYVRARQGVSEQANHREDGSEGVYFRTVSQGGKDGYGISSAKILTELRKAGVKVSTSNSGQKIAVLFHNPYSIYSLEAPYRILYTMFESDKIPDDWKEYMDAADLVITPSKWCQAVFAKAGVKSEVVPLGYDDTVFRYKPREDKMALRKDFVFIHYNAFNVRKGFLEVFKAFTQEFRPDEPVKMIFKTTLDHIPLSITKSEYPNIEIVMEKMDEGGLVDLLYRSDCLVFPSRGEGFGMTPLEAMATGIPAIVPNAHGISEYFDSDYMYEAPVEKLCPAVYARYKGQDVGKMVQCDVDALAKQMRYVYEHQDEAREKGRRAAEYVKNWTFKKTALHLKQIIEKTERLDLRTRPLKNELKLEKIT